ncbi:hypothetical protein GVX82_04315 [Patescibacteria group bacterium]|nr:hypothetical protein [Patescibacteria group bacterium]
MRLLGHDLGAFSGTDHRTTGARGEDAREVTPQEGRLEPPTHRLRDRE